MTDLAHLPSNASDAEKVRYYRAILRMDDGELSADTLKRHARAQLKALGVSPVSSGRASSKAGRNYIKPLKNKAF